MTTYRLFPATNGPGSPVSYSGNFLAGVLFKVTQGGMWFNGYYHWVPTGGDTVSRKFALWNVTGNGTGTLISAATVASSGTLTAGAWNFIPLATPIPLAIGTTYNACTGWLAVNGFPDSDTGGVGTGAGDSFGTGGHTAGITQGPLFAFSDGPASGGTKYEPYIGNQGVFSTAGTDPTVNMPAAGSNSGNFWMDVQVSDTGPASYSGSYRLYPNKFDANLATAPDASVNYVVATEFALSQACTLNKIWYYSPSGTAQLATSADIWSILGPNSGSIVAGTDSPSWSGAAGSGWVSCSFSGVTLPAGSYKVSVFNNAGTPDGWGAKDASTKYWDTGDGASGITWGPLSAPGLATASLAYEFGGTSGTTPPWTNGVTERGQSTFEQTGTNIYPALYVDGLAQNYWLDVEVTPVVATPAPPPLIPPGFQSPMAFTAFMPVPQGGALVSAADTGTGTDTGSVATAVSDADTGTGADTGSVAAAVSGADTGSAADTGSVAVAVSDADTATAADAATVLTPAPPPSLLIPPGFASPMAFTAFQPPPQPAGTAVSDADTGTGADTGSVAAAVSGADTGSAADTGSVAVAVSGADTAVAADAGSVAVAVSAADTASGTDAGSVMALTPSQPVPIPPGFISPMAFTALRPQPSQPVIAARPGTAAVTDAPAATVAIINVINGTVVIGNAS